MLFDVATQYALPTDVAAVDTRSADPSKIATRAAVLVTGSMSARCAARSDGEQDRMPEYSFPAAVDNDQTRSRPVRA